MFLGTGHSSHVSVVRFHDRHAEGKQGLGESRRQRRLGNKQRGHCFNKGYPDVIPLPGDIPSLRERHWYDQGYTSSDSGA